MWRLCHHRQILNRERWSRSHTNPDSRLWKASISWIRRRVVVHSRRIQSNGRKIYHNFDVTWNVLWMHLPVPELPISPHVGWENVTETSSEFHEEVWQIWTCHAQHLERTTNNGSTDWMEDTTQWNQNRNLHWSGCPCGPAVNMVKELVEIITRDQGLDPPLKPKTLIEKEDPSLKPAIPVCQQSGRAQNCSGNDWYPTESDPLSVSPNSRTWSLTSTTT